MTGSPAPPRRHRFERGLYVALVLAYVALRLAHWSTIDEMAQGRDTAVYVQVASAPLSHAAFWCGMRPWTVPLVYKVLQNNPDQIGLVQLVLSMTCWVVLAVAVRGAIRTPWLRPIATVTILLLSLSTTIMGWDSRMVSESISISLLALFLAGWLRVVSERGWLKVTWLLLVALLWCFARDSNAGVILMLAVVLLAFGGLRRDGPALLIAGAFGACVVASAISVAGGRWVVPFLDVFSDRILPRPDRVAYFAGRGMPSAVAVERLTGPLDDGKWRAFRRDPALDDFRRWAYVRGRREYVRFLLVHPVRTLLQPLRDARQLFLLDSRRSAPLLPGRVERVVYFRDKALVAVTLLAVILGTVVVFGLSTGRLRWRRAWSVPLVLLGLVYPHVLLTWHGDSHEIARHAVQASIQLRLGGWLLLLFAVDGAVALRPFRARSR